MLTDEAACSVLTDKCDRTQVRTNVVENKILGLSNSPTRRQVCAYGAANTGITVSGDLTYMDFAFKNNISYSNTTSDFNVVALPDLDHFYIKLLLTKYNGD